MEKLYSRGRIDCKFISDLFEVIGGNAYINDMGRDWFVMSKKLKSNKSNSLIRCNMDNVDFSIKRF